MQRGGLGAWAPREGPWLNYTPTAPSLSHTRALSHTNVTQEAHDFPLRMCSALELRF
jgi:hypothetical protein